MLRLHGLLLFFSLAFVGYRHIAIAPTSTDQASGMPPRAANVPFQTRAWNFLLQRKRDFFFAGVALFALGTVVRRELMMKGVVAPPSSNQAKGLPRVERKFGDAKEKSL